MVLTMSQKLAFFACGVCNAIVKDNGDGNAKSPPHIRSRARCERGMALAAAVSPRAAENHSREFGVHDGTVFYFHVFARFFDLVLSLRYLPTFLVLLLVFRSGGGKSSVLLLNETFFRIKPPLSSERAEDMAEKCLDKILATMYKCTLESIWHCKQKICQTIFRISSPLQWSPSRSRQRSYC